MRSERISATSFLRPDGVVQLLTQDYLAFQAPRLRSTVTSMNAQLDGTWTEVLRTEESSGHPPGVSSRLVCGMGLDYRCNLHER